MKLAKNKRGLSTDFLADFYAFFGIILTLIIFFILFSVSIGGCQGPGIQASIIGMASNDLNEEMMLLNYLRTKVDVNREEMTMAKLVADSYLEDDYSMLEEKTKEVLGQIDEGIYTTGKCSIVCIDDDNGRVKEIESEGCEGMRITEAPCQKTMIQVPLPYTQPVEVLGVSFSYNVESISESIVQDVHGTRGLKQ